MSNNKSSNSPRLSTAAIDAANTARLAKAATISAKAVAESTKKAHKAFKKAVTPVQVGVIAFKLFAATMKGCAEYLVLDTVWPVSTRTPAVAKIVADVKVAPSSKNVNVKGLKAQLSTTNDLTSLAGETNELEASVLYSLPYRDTDAWNVQAGKLIDFYSLNKICALPVPSNKKLLIIKKSGKDATFVYPWIDFLISIGVDLYYAVESSTMTKDGLVTKLKSAKFSKYRYSDGYVGVKGHKHATEVDFIPYEADVHTDVTNHVYAHNIQDFVAGYYVSWMSDLTPVQLAELFSILSKEAKAEGSTVHIVKPNGGFSIDFAEGLIENTAVTQMVVPNVMIGGSQASGLVALFMVGLGMANPNFQSWQFKGFLNKIPGMWVEDLNYGVKTDKSDPSIAIPFYAYNKLDVVKRFEGTSVSHFPWLVLSNPTRKVDMADVKQCLEEEGVITGDKYLLKFFAGRASANAALIGDGGKWIYTLHDAGKPSKLWNRPMQSCKFLKCEQYTSSNFMVKCRKESLFATQLPNGELVRQSGRVMTIALSNSGLALGSGSVLITKDTEFNLGVEKTLSGRVSLHDFSAAGVKMLTSSGVKSGETVHHAFNYLKKAVASKIEAIDTTKFFKSGESILEINTLPGTKVIIKNTFSNVPVRVISGKVRHVETSATDYSPSYFNIELKVEALATTQCVKNRRYFTKNTTTPDVFSFYDLDGNPITLELEGKTVEMLFNNETIKGRSVHIDAFANTVGVNSVYLPNDGLLKVEDTFVDLLQATNVVSEWVENTVQDVLLELSVAKAEWDMLVAADSLTGIVSVVDHGTYVVVKEKIQVLVCKLNFEVEISTPDESISTSAMTPEMVAGISVQSKKLAELLMVESQPSQDAILGLVNMITQTIPITTSNSINLNSSVELEFMKNKVGSLDGLSDSKVLDLYKAMSPQGLYLKASNGDKSVVMFVDFNIVRTTMVWISGSADQISQEIIAFLRAIVNPPETGYDSFMYNHVIRLNASLRGWLREAFASKGVLKRAARTSKCLVNLKVRTCYYTFLQPDADNLPKVAVNPSCDATALLGKDSQGRYYKKYLQSVFVSTENVTGSFDDDNYTLTFAPTSYCRVAKVKQVVGGYTLSFFNPELLDGELISAFRIPMFMGLGAKLVVTDKVGRSHAFLLPYLWSMANEGDTDGDGISLLNVGIRGLTVDDINEMNDSWVGVKGYKIIYGDNVSKWPYAEFSEKPKKKWMKWDTAEDKAKYCLPYVSSISKYSYVNDAGKTSIGYFESGELVQKHYVAAVGIAYGIASVLTFKLADMLYSDKQDNVKAMKLAVVVAWRAIYEGLGLAGYSEAATKWFAILGASKISGTYVCKDGVYMSPKDKRATKEDKVLDAAYSLLFLGEDEEVGNGLSKFWEGKELSDGSNPYFTLMYKAMKAILEAEKTRTFFGGLEKGSNVTKLIRTDDQLKDAYIFGGLRRMGQGADPAGITMRDANLFDDGTDEDVILPISLFAGIDQSGATSRLSCPWLKSMLDKGTYIHNRVSTYLHDELVAERDADQQED